MAAALALGYSALTSASSPKARELPLAAIADDNGKAGKRPDGVTDGPSAAQPANPLSFRGTGVYPPPDPPVDDPEATPALDPEEWRSGDAHSLRVQKTTTPFAGAARAGGPNEVEAITYNGRLVGPTIRVRRGTTVKITVTNDLPATGAPAVTVAPGQEDPPHDLFTTNLHTHGLHVSPEGNSDNVFREIAPGGSFEYAFKIPADHPCGTFWYHPHKHGAVAYQMANGMAGALIVEGGPAGAVPALDDIPEIARAQERVFVLQQFILRRDQHGVGRVDPNDLYGAPDPSAYSVTAVNGAVMPTYHMRPKEVQRWRFIHAGRDEPIHLHWRTAGGMRILNFPFHEIALDGLATGTLPRARAVRLYPGNRSDVLVKAPAERGTYHLASLQESADGARMTVKFVAKLVVNGPDLDMALPDPARLAACKPFPSIAPAECTAKRDLVFDFDDAKKLFHINGASFSRQIGADAAVLGSAEEWTLTASGPAGVPGAAGSPAVPDPHPFHVHVNPVQVVQIEDLQTRTVTKVDQWRDTVPVDYGKKVTIRLRFRDFAGTTVYHCHTLDHEDQGMMRTLRITDPARPEGRDDPAAKLTDCAIPAPPLKLPTAQNGAWDLAAPRQGAVVLVFFRGMGCIHCTRELHDLLRATAPGESPAAAFAGTTIVAVSSEPIENPDKAVESLDVPPGVRFQLAVDEGHRAFRSFGCYDQGPQHGLFLIDPTGLIRARYAGNVPFADPAQVRIRLRQLLARSEAVPGGQRPKLPQ
jgi:FtsP/CotA-like multicopper oxidase with cupredoxin domain/peroxiredoxin